MIFKILLRMMSATRCYSNNIRNWIMQLFQQELVFNKEAIFVLQQTNNFAT